MAKSAKKAATFRDRIKDFRRVPARELQADPRNWRTHSKTQQNALRGILSEVGYADAVIARETPEGVLVLIDGHLRVETTPDQMVPVLVVDVDEMEAGKLLLVLDPLAALAGSDGTRLDALLRDVETGNEALRDLLAKLAEEAGIAPDEPEAPDEFREVDEDIETNCTCPKCGFQWSNGQ